MPPLHIAGFTVLYNAHFGSSPPSVPILLDQLSCTGSEARLVDCRHSGVGVVSSFCNHNEDAGVRCAGKSHGYLRTWTTTDVVGYTITIVTTVVWLPINTSNAALYDNFPLALLPFVVYLLHHHKHMGVYRLVVMNVFHA